MSKRLRRMRARLSILLAQNALPLSLVAAWLAVNAVVFSEKLGVAPCDLVEVLLGLSRAPGSWGRLYQPFTQLFVFGVLASMVATNATRKYRPEQTCRLLAGQARDHVVVVGHGHLGQRIRQAMLRAGVDVVVVDDDPENIAPLVRDEEPLVLGDGRHGEDLDAASVDRARVVAIVTDDVEAAVVAARHVRARNPRCELIVRCPDDDVGDVLARVYRARVVSTSKLTAKLIAEDAGRRGTRRAVVIGDNSVGRRTAAALEARSVATRLAPATEEARDLAAAGVAETDLVVIADDDLGKNLIRVDRVRDLSPSVRIVCRVFHDDAAEVLTQRPFQCTVVSTSRHALEVLVREGAFRKVGLATLEGRGARALCPAPA